jgi:hypothetical protein
MSFKNFVKSIWFAVLLFALLEITTFVIGSFVRSGVECMCMPPPAVCNCPHGRTYGVPFLLIGIVPNAIFSLFAYFLAKKFVKD